MEGGTEESSLDATAVLELLDWKRRVFGLYGAVRAASDPAEARQRWAEGRDELFRSHPSSPVQADSRASFGRLPYFAYDPALRALGTVESLPVSTIRIGSSGDQPIAFDRFGAARFRLAGDEHTLELYWLGGYGGGVFCPFRDETSGAETYGGGRYLLDTVKGADLGMDGGRIILDFNFAYNPSCSYDPGWVCPLSPPANRLPIAIRAGERMP